MIFLAETILKIILAAILTFAGSFWVEKLYSGSDELTFPKKIAERAKFRKPILFFSLAILFNLTDEIFLLPAIFLLILMILTDFEQYMLFDEMTFSLAVLGFIFAWHSSFLAQGCFAALVGGGIFAVLAVFSRGSLGGGDVKLIFALGFWLGEKLFNVVLFGTVLGGFAAVIMILLKKKDRKSYFAYGPYFSLCTIYFLLS